MLGLQERQKWHHQGPDLKEDDVVLMVDENQRRSHWRLARILSVHRSGDGLIRTTRIQTADQSIYERAVQKLIFLFRPEN